MEKTEILSELKKFEANLADKEIVSEDRAEVLDKAWNAFDKYDRRLRREDADKYEYDEVAFQNLEYKQQKVYDDLLEARKNAAEFAISIDKNSKEISKLKNKLEKKLPGILASYKKDLADYDKWLSRKNLSSEERTRLEAKRKEILEFEETDKEAEEFARKRIEELEEANRELSEQIDEQEKIEAGFSSEYEKNDIKLEQIRTASKLTPEQRQQAEYEATMLYTRYKFLEMDPKKELSNLISEYESGRITERDLILRLSDINEILNTVMYDLKDVTTLSATEAVIARRKEIQAKIDELEKKVDDKSNYRKQNKDAENRIWAYNKILSAYEPERNEIALQIKAKQDEIKEYEDVLKSSDELSPIEKEKFASERAETKEIIDRKEKEIKALELKLKNNKKREKETKETIMKLNEEFFDRDARAKDMALLVEQRGLLDATYSEEALERTSFISEFNGFTRTLKSGKNLRGDDQMYPFLRNLTPEDRADAEYLYKSFPIAPDPKYPSFWNDLSDNQKEIYFDWIKGHTPEEIKEFNDGIVEGLAAEKAEAERLAKEEADRIASGRTRAGETVTVPGDTIPEGMRVDKPIPPAPPLPDPKDPPLPDPKDETEFGDPSKDKTSKWKEFWTKSKLRTALIAAAAVAVLLAAGTTLYAVLAGNTNSNPEATPTPTPTASATVNPEESPKPTTEPTVKPQNTAKPKPTDKPEVTTPVITPTPTPAVGVINLQTAAPVGTGDSAPADKNVPYLDGLSTQDTTTHTYVDSDGTKITVNANGTLVKPNSQAVTTNANGTVSIPENLDMSAIPTPTPTPVTAQTPVEVKTALNSGAISQTEADMANAFFDNQYAQVEQTPGINNGR